MRDSGQPDWRCGEVAGQFELKGAYLEGPVAKLSGGWQTRVKLAALLLHDPNLLLLDEPTNFLDLRTQILLEHFLRNFKEACLIVSHDRAFLSATCTHTLDLARGHLTMFPGPIEAFLEYQHERREHEERTNSAVLAKRKQLQEFIDKNKARASTATRARSKSKQLERLELVDIDSDEPTANIRPPVGRAAQGARLALPRPDDRLSRTRDRRRHRRRDRTRLAGGDRGRQRARQNDVSADRRRFAQAAGRRSTLGLWLPDRRLRPARLHQSAGHAIGPRLSGIQRGTRHQNPTDSGRRRGPALPRRSREETDLGPVGRRTGKTLPGRAAAQPIQRAGPRRAGQPLGRRHGRRARPGADRLQGNRRLHQPRPALHAPRGNLRRRSPRWPT